MTPGEWTSRTEGHPWKKVMVRILWDSPWPKYPELVPGVLYEVLDTRAHGRESFVMWEEWYQEEGEGGQPVFQVYRWYVDPDGPNPTSIDWDRISTESGFSVDVLQIMATSPNPYDRALLYRWHAHLEGATFLDSFPETLTREELKTRWPEICPESGSHAGTGGAC